MSRSLSRQALSLAVSLVLIAAIAVAAGALVRPVTVHAGGRPGSPPDPTLDAAIVHRLVFEVPLTEFRRIVVNRMNGDHWLDWSTDWCSAPLVGSVGRTFDFRWPCRRHDFAYRNTRLLDARYACSRRPAGTVCPLGTTVVARWWTSTARAAIDRQLRSDMRATCWHRVPWQWSSCLSWAEVFYRAVRIAGGP